MSSKNKGAVSLMKGVNIPVETQQAQDEDAAREKAEQHEKAVEAALETALKFVESTAQFHKWLEASPLVNQEAYSRAQKEAVKRATQDVDHELAQLRAQMAALEAQKVKASAAFGLPATTTTQVKGKRGRKPKGSVSTLVNESDILTAVGELGEASIDKIAEKLNLTDKKALSLQLKKLRGEKKLGDKGARRGLKYILP